MTESKTSFDAAALAGATLAATLVLFTKAGPYDWFACIVGITLLLVIIAYEYPRRRERWVETIALSAVAALAALLVVGYGWESVSEILKVPLSKDCKEIVLSSGLTGSVCEADSRVASGTQSLIWIILVVLFSVIDRRHHKHPPKSVETDNRPETGSPIPTETGQSAS